jgi:hypothetical protein
MCIFLSLWLQRTLLLWPGIVASGGHVGHYCLSSVKNSVAVRLTFPHDCKILCPTGDRFMRYCLPCLFLVLNKVLQAVSRVSWISLNYFFYSWCCCYSVAKLFIQQLYSTYILVRPLRKCSMICMRFPWKFAMSHCSNLYLTPLLLFPVGWIIAFALPRSHFMFSGQVSWSCILCIVYVCSISCAHYKVENFP